MNIKKWEVAPLDKERAAQLAERYSLPFFLAMLLEIRGVNKEEEIRDLLSGGQLSDPFLMKDMDKAVERIRRAIDNFEKIAVYGDYDADGVTATSILFTYLEAVGADVMYYIPQREGEGYGMNLHAVETLHQEGVTLIVTVDNGIASVNEVERAAQLGIDVVVTDHHRPQERVPSAYAVVDAYQPDDHGPYKDLSGAGVALKLVMALEDGDAGAVMEEYADLAALGTVADVVPVLGENRAIVKAGLAILTRGGRAGVDALMEQSGVGGKAATATSLAFTVIPRINATGRMGAPERAVRLLTCETQEEAEPLSAEICEDNDHRREVEAQIAKEAMEKIEQDPALLYSRVIVVDGEGWHHGVIGIVASRITERFGKPSMVISTDGQMAKGSGRSVEGFSLFEAICACGDLMERYGGHPMAAGITLPAENVPLFRERINQYAAQVCREMPAPVLRVDCKLNPSALTPDMPQSLRPMALWHGAEADHPGGRGQPFAAGVRQAGRHPHLYEIQHPSGGVPLCPWGSAGPGCHPGSQRVPGGTSAYSQRPGGEAFRFEYGGLCPHLPAVREHPARGIPHPGRGGGGPSHPPGLGWAVPETGFVPRRRFWGAGPVGQLAGDEPGQTAAGAGYAAGAAVSCPDGRGGTAFGPDPAHPGEGGYFRFTGVPAGESPGEVRGKH